jgi:aspartate carbamoyltransferase catalytic subunit
MKHLISSQDFSRAEYDELFRRYKYFLDNGISPDLCRGKVVATLFFQPSTRTMNMFQSAAIRLGGGWIGVMGEKGLSMEKGESFEETIREYSCFADMIVLRHPDDDSAERAAKASFVPIVNGGSGSREHALAAAFILFELAHFLKRPMDGLKIGIYGTPEINRVCKAMVPIFGLYGAELFIDDLGCFPLPKEVEKRAKANGLKSMHYGKLDDFIGNVDILIITRAMQKGIISDDKFPKEKADYIAENFKPINRAHMKKLRKDAILYMLKPRIFEIERNVDFDPRAVYAQKETYVEMAASLISFILDVKI